ncbi:MAG: AraC family transcriptional regulator [Pseudomonadota bacterium]|nr:AraC family transcriptional regulator [Pseudomonadota bacterium]
MSGHEKLAALIDKHAPTDGVHATAIPRLQLIRASAPSEPMPIPYEPAVCIVAQGEKKAILGGAILRYDPAKYLVVSAEVPVVCHVTKASRASPYLCLRLDLDLSALGAMMLEFGIEPVRGDAPGPALALSAATPELIDSAARLISLLDTPKDTRALSPLAEREILYRLMTGEQADKIRQVAVADSKLAQVSRAIRWIKANYAKPFRIETVAAEARMSPSALHQHFKAVTAMSPLQYQKQLRLQEARRLLLLEAVDAASAAHRVGYESPSQFSREYARAFGAPPMRDIARLKTAPPPALGA